MEQEFSQIQLADVANEVNADLKIEFHTASYKFTKEQLLDIKEKGYPTSGLACVVAGLYFSGMEEEEIHSFLDEAIKAQSSLKIALEARDGEALNVRSPEENPLLNQLFQLSANQPDSIEETIGETEIDVDN